MIDLFWVLPLAIAMGIVVGILPGMSSVVGMILAMPLIGHLSVHEILMFFACYLCVVQYYGSMSALLFRIPGETSSLPVLIASQGLKARPIIKSIKITALGSFVASMLGIIVLFLIFSIDKNVWIAFFDTKFLMIFLAGIFLLLIVRGHVWLNILLVSSGVMISNLHEMPMMFRACSQYPWSCFVLQPADITLILLSIYSVPLLFGRATKFHSEQRCEVQHTVHWKSFWPYRWVQIKHGMLGMIIGLVPGMGVTLASNISAKLQSMRRPRNRLAIMSAAESSNNSATISSLIPFLMLGLPITASELYLDAWLLVFKNSTVNFELFYQSVDTPIGSMPYYVIFLAGLLCVNFVVFRLSSGFSKIYQSILIIPLGYIDRFVKAAIVFAVVAVIWFLNIDIASAIVILVVFGALGVWAHQHNVDIIAFPIALVIGKYAFDIFSKAYYLYL